MNNDAAMQWAAFLFEPPLYLFHVKHRDSLPVEMIR